jgi:hypothetical protein
MKKLCFVLSLLSIMLLQAQTPNSYESTQISILTIGPGTSLNDAFGHNGIRVKTPYNDVVYDYGRFPFNDPDFYLNFARGKLLYSQGFSDSYHVINFYKSQNRTIKEQVLNLTTQEKQDMHSYLVNNSLPENKEYLYDFFFDNCATKIRDVNEIITNNNIVFHTSNNLGNNSFRDLIEQNLNWNSWGSLGIDVALGSIIDRKATAYEHMFLPAYIYSSFETATIKSTNEKLVKESKVLNSVSDVKTANPFFSSPIFILSLLSIFILWLTYKNYKNQSRSKWLDFSIFLVTGVIGVFILLLWFATDHTATANNYNLLWAFALNLVLVNEVLKKNPKLWFVKYLKLLVILLCLLVFHWVLGVQGFAFALIPLLLALTVRYLYLVKYFSKEL